MYSFMLNLLQIRNIDDWGIIISKKKLFYECLFLIPNYSLFIHSNILLFYFLFSCNKKIQRNCITGIIRFAAQIWYSFCSRCISNQSQTRKIRKKIWMNKGSRKKSSWPLKENNIFHTSVFWQVCCNIWKKNMPLLSKNFVEDFFLSKFVSGYSKS